MPDPPRPHGSLALERLVFFTDAVMAIAITLLAIELRLPEGHVGSDHELMGALAALTPRFVAFVVSFAVIGMYWFAHHRMFGYIERFNGGLAALNLVFLFFVALLPFLTAVLGEHGNLPSATALYASGMAGMGFTSSGLWLYSVRRRLVSPDLPAATRRYLAWRGLTVPLMFASSIPLAFVSPHLAQLWWAAILPIQRTLAWRAGTRTAVTEQVPTRYPS